MSKIRSSLALLVGCVWALGLGGTAALAADMGLPVKAPPAPPPPPSWWSGFVELDYESFLINPQGQALIPHSSESLVAGLNLTLYKDKAGFINNVTVGGLVATDWSGSFSGYWAGLPAPGPNDNGALFDAVFAVSQSVTFGQYWTLSNEFFNVYSQDVVAAAPGATYFHGFGYLVFDQIKLALNDSFTGWPITFNPYIAFYYEWPGGSGQTPACFTCAGNAGDWIAGITPTLSLEKYWGVPITLKAPTYVTFGQSSFWGTGLTTASLGPGVASSGGVGLFTTGLTAVIPLKFIPGQYGSWYVKGGFQWYDVINTALQQDNAFSVCGPTAASCASWQTNSIIVGFAGIGVGF